MHQSSDDCARSSVAVDLRCATDVGGVSLIDSLVGRE